MNKEIRKQVKALEKLKLGELQARFAEIVGEETLAPNRKFLMWRITEALEVQAADQPTAEPEPKAETKPAKKRRAAKTAEEPAQETQANDEEGTPLRDLSVQELQAIYEEKVGRPTAPAHGGWEGQGDIAW